MGRETHTHTHTLVYTHIKQGIYRALSETQSALNSKKKHTTCKFIPIYTNPQRYINTQKTYKNQQTFSYKAWSNTRSHMTAQYIYTLDRPARDAVIKRPQTQYHCTKRQLNLNFQPEPGLFCVRLFSQFLCHCVVCSSRRYAFYSSMYIFFSLPTVSKLRRFYLSCNATW